MSSSMFQCSFSTQNPGWNTLSLHFWTAFLGLCLFANGRNEYFAANRARNCWRSGVISQRYDWPDLLHTAWLTARQTRRFHHQFTATIFRNNGYLNLDILFGSIKCFVSSFSKHHWFRFISNGELFYDFLLLGFNECSTIVSLSI